MRRAAPLLLLLVVLCVWGRTIAGEFVGWDDSNLILQNPHLNPPTPAGLAFHWSHPHQDMYIPAVYTLWWVLASVARLPTPDANGVWLNPYIFHIANLLVHLLSTWIVFAILRPLIRSDWAALAGAIFFAIHPLQTEAVAWVTGMKDLLSGMLGLLAIWQYTQAASGREARRHYFLATIAFILALLAKPSAVSVPLIALVLDVFLIRRSWRDSLRWIWPWLMVAIVFTILAARVQPAAAAIDAGPIWARPLIAADSLAFYLFKLAIPWNLCVDYGRTPQVVLHQRWVYFAWLIPATLAILIAKSGRRQVMAAGLIFLAGLAPLLGLAPFVFQLYSTVADRYTYLAMLGPALAVAYGLSLLRPGVSAILATAAGLILAILSFIQAGYWSDSETLYRHALAVNPNSLAGHNGMGSLYMSARQYPLALDEFQKSLQIQPENPIAQSNIGQILMGMHHPAEAVPHFQIVLRSVDEPWIHNNLGAALAQSGHKKEAISQFLIALKETPGTPELHTNIADLYSQEGDLPLAIEHYRAALAINPAFAPARQGLAEAMQQTTPATTRP